MKSVLFYSFKGGTGRSTAAANVAVELADRGHNVLLIDLDVEGGGLHLICGVRPNSDQLRIQDYLDPDPDVDFDPDVRAFMLDLKQEWGTKGYLALIPATQGPDLKRGKTVTFENDKVELALRHLWKKLRKEQTDPAIDIIIMDSPLGYGDMTYAALKIADAVLMLFRPNQQAIEGTAEMVRLFERAHLPSFGVTLRVKSYHLVAAGMPDGRPAIEQRAIATLNERLGAEGFKKPIEARIPDCEDLRFRERIIMHDTSDEFGIAAARAGYRQLADLVEKVTGIAR